ncbi:MAG TPA: O-antigen ligase family protein [Puia sp.]|nr:O-antigen ligase family protein [Puia sp.]
MRSILLLDPVGKAFTIKEKILYFGVGAFFISFLLPDMPVINNIVTGAIILNCFLYNSFAEKKQLLWQRKEIFFMILFYALHIVSAFLSADRQEGMEMLVLRAPLLAFPISIGLIVIREELKDRILLFFSVIITLTALACLIYAFGQYLKFHDAVYLYDDSLTDLTRKQSIYFALLVNLTLFCYAYLLLKPTFRFYYKGVVYLAIAFLLVFHFMLASRIAIITLYSSLLLFAVFHFMQRKAFFKGAILIIGVLAGSFLLVRLFPKTLNRFKELTYTEYQFSHHGVESHYNMKVTADQWNGANLRLALWKCGWELSLRHWALGVPLGDKQVKLMEIYKEKHFDIAFQSRRNVHNNYLDVLYCFGVFGFTVFLLGYFVLPLIEAFKDRDILGAVIIGAFAAALITETYMDRSIGCLLLAFFLSFISSTRNFSSVGKSQA